MRHPTLSPVSVASTAATATPARTARFSWRAKAASLALTLALACETIGADVAKGCLHRIRLGLFGAQVGAIRGVASIRVFRALAPRGLPEL